MNGGRIAVHLDAVAVDKFDPYNPVPSDENALGLLRIVSTHRRLRTLLEDDANLQPGDWVEVKVASEQGQPEVWSLQLEGGRFIGREEGGRERPSQSNIVSIRRLSRYGEAGAPQPLGAGVTRAAINARHLRTVYSLNSLSHQVTPALVNWLLAHGGKLFETSIVEVVDVGQASFNCLRRDNAADALLYFDVGQPVWFHLHSLPKGFSLKSPDPRSVVVLSHWDTDHYAYGRQNKEFHDLLWIAPAQASVGPNAYKFAKQLSDAGNLLLVGPGKSSRHRRGVRLIRSNGKSINGSGLSLHLKALGRNILLTGDADYNEIPGIGGINFSGLQIPHHGGRLSTGCVIPNGHGKAHAVASCGMPNRYKHPNQITLRDHSDAGWHVSITAQFARAPRGNRII